MLDNMHSVKFHIPNNKPFIFSELGAGAKRGMSGAEDELKNLFGRIPGIGLSETD